jgi:phage gp16-like protein
MSAAPKARFDGARQHRRSMIAKIHVAKKQLCIADDDYRQIIFGATGKISSKDCSDTQLLRVIEALKSKGFAALPVQGKARPADHPVAKKARAMWISLSHLGVVRNSSDAALEAFAKRQLGVARLQWADQSQGYILIEALKNMAEREGWSQKFGSDVRRDQYSRLLTKRLCEAILEKLKAKNLAANHWSLSEAVHFLCGEQAVGHFDAFGIEQWNRLARNLGQILQEQG